MTRPTIIPCPTCRYDLRGLLTPDGAHCPECGGTFTLQQVRPPQPQYRVSTRTLVVLLVLTPLVILLSSAGITVIAHVFHLKPPYDISIMAIAAGFLWATGIELILLRRAQQTSIWQHRLYPLVAAPLLGAVIALASIVVIFTVIALVVISSK